MPKNCSAEYQRQLALAATICELEMRREYEAKYDFSWDAGHETWKQKLATDLLYLQKPWTPQSSWTNIYVSDDDEIYKKYDLEKNNNKYQPPPFWHGEEPCGIPCLDKVTSLVRVRREHSYSATFSESRKMSEYQQLTLEIQVPKEWPVKDARTVIIVQYAIICHLSGKRVVVSVFACIINA
ncbi:hypothetical protein evm_004132 [Chilo suppressalis]|nr:hypothetical protein evm_004132 [Chilo suppressalis]